MKKGILKKLYHGFIQLHILHHSRKEAIYGIWMMSEPEKHGYNIGPGTMYPLLKKMTGDELLI